MKNNGSTDINISPTLFKHIIAKNKNISEGEKDNANTNSCDDGGGIGKTNELPSERFVTEQHRKTKMSSDSTNHLKDFSTQENPDMTFDPNYIMRHAAFDPSILLFGIRGEYEQKFQQYQRLWRQKWEELNRINNELHKANSEKLKNEVNRVENMYFHDYSFLETPCQHLETKVLECYQMNQQKSLLCSDLVKKFASCIEDSRLKLLKHKETF